jgi:hypothetical protein
MHVVWYLELCFSWCHFPSLCTCDELGNCDQWHLANVNAGAYVEVGYEQMRCHHLKPNGSQAAFRVSCLGVDVRAQR